MSLNSAATEEHQTLQYLICISFQVELPVPQKSTTMEVCQTLQKCKKMVQIFRDTNSRYPKISGTSPVFTFYLSTVTTDCGKLGSDCFHEAKAV